MNIDRYEKMEDDFEEWLWSAVQYYRRGHNFKKIKEMIGGSKSDFNALKDYIHSNKIVQGINPYPKKCKKCGATVFSHYTLCEMCRIYGKNPFRRQ